MRLPVTLLKSPATSPISPRTIPSWPHGARADGAIKPASEERLHIHVQSPDGEAKFWIEPQIELARNYELSDQDLSRALKLVVDHEQEIRAAWHEHFDT